MLGVVRDVVTHHLHPGPGLNPGPGLHQRILKHGEQTNWPGARRAVEIIPGQPENGEQMRDFSIGPQCHLDLMKQIASRVPTAQLRRTQTTVSTRSDKERLEEDTVPPNICNNNLQTFPAREEERTESGTEWIQIAGSLLPSASQIWEIQRNLR